MQSANYNITYSTQAKNDLLEIYEYILIEKSNPFAADKVVDRIQNAIDKLVFLAQRNSVVKLKRGIYYRLLVGNYVVLYKIKGDQVSIMYVIYGKRNYINML